MLIEIFPGFSININNINSIQEIEGGCQIKYGTGTHTVAIEYLKLMNILNTQQKIAENAS